MLIDASAVGAGVVACLAAFADADVTAVDVVARRGALDGIAIDAALVPFADAARYVAVSVPICGDGTVVSAATDVDALFAGDACFAAKPPTEAAEARPASPSGDPSAAPL
jgi:hypothetical protein